jgi:hypothetical protein
MYAYYESLPALHTFAIPSNANTWRQSWPNTYVGKWIMCTAAMPFLTQRYKKLLLHGFSWEGLANDGAMLFKGSDGHLEA